MTELDAEIGPLALDLINEYGKSIEYAVVGEGVYNSDTATVEAPAPLFVGIKAIVEEYNGQAFLTGLIEGGDKKVTVAAQAFAELPTTGDKLKIDGVTYMIMAVKIVYSGDLAAIYELQARR